ncbi:hypothetical protein O3P69_016165 [Scylla paramamosain]|uniref:Uncharacterized protein n=1 Tax=Scylla paramamosain TaxID=85552 RepID=A0AAW0SH22_SCYPA
MHPLPHLPHQQPPPPPSPSSHHRYPRLGLHLLQPASLTPREATRGLSAAQVSPSSSTPQKSLPPRDPHGDCGVGAGWWRETDRRLQTSSKLTGGGCRAASTHHHRLQQPPPHCSSFLYTNPHPLSITKKEQEPERRDKDECHVSPTPTSLTYKLLKDAISLDSFDNDGGSDPLGQQYLCGERHQLNSKATMRKSWKSLCKDTL